MPTYNSRSQSLYYTRLGPLDGQCMVFLHGFTNYSGLWMPQALAFAYRGYKVLLPDLAGHGLSQPADALTTVDDLAEDVVALLDAEGESSACVCGLSLGGMVALTTAVEYPERTDKLVVAGSSARANQEASVRQIDGWIQTLEADDGPVNRLEKAWSHLCMTAFRESAHGQSYFATWKAILQGLPGSSLANIARGMQHYDVSDRLSRIACPTLVITGLEDEIISPRSSASLAQNISQAQLVEMAEAGHLATLDKPLVVYQAIEGFLNDPK